jgi:hypothetical protein
MRYSVIFLVCILWFAVNALAQDTPQFLMPIQISDAAGRVDTFWWGYDMRAKNDTLNINFGEKLESKTIDPKFDFFGAHGDDRWDLNYPSKKIISGTEVEFCPFVFASYLFVYSTNPPIKLSFDNGILPVECRPYRSEIVSLDDFPILVEDWASESEHYYCMSFTNEIVDDVISRDTFFDINTTTVNTLGDTITMAGFLIVAKGFGECATLNNTKRLSLEELKLSPNLVHSELSMPVQSGVFGEMQWSILSLSGQSLMAGNHWQESIDVSHLSPGQYFFLIRDKESLKLGRFTKV